MAGFELLKLEDFADFVEKSDVDAGYVYRLFQTT